MLKIGKVYKNNKLVYKGNDKTRLLRHLKDQGAVVWVDFVGATHADLKEFKKQLKWHPLAIEDAISALQRPKIDQYRYHAFLSLHRVDTTKKKHDVNTLKFSEIDVFLGPNYVVTDHDDDSAFLINIAKRWDKGSEESEIGVGQMLYSIADTIVDGYFRVVDIFEDSIDEIEDKVFGRSGSKALKEIFYAKKQLLYFRKVATAMRDVVSSLSKHDHRYIGSEYSGYFLDVLDHVIRTLDAIDIYRDLLTNTIESHLSIVSNRLNEVMKELTSWASILIVNSWIAGIYGMNFVKPWPAFEDPNGFWIAILIMVASTIALYTYFKRRDWL